MHFVVAHVINNDYCPRIVSSLTNIITDRTRYQLMIAHFLLLIYGLEHKVIFVTK